MPFEQLLSPFVHPGSADGSAQLVSQCTFQCNHNVVPSPTEWGPPVISWFITPSKYSYLRIIHYGYDSFLHQLSVHELGPLGPFPYQKKTLEPHIFFDFRSPLRRPMMEVVRTDVMRGAFGRVAFGDVRCLDVSKKNPYNLTQGAIFGVKNGEVMLSMTEFQIFPSLVTGVGKCPILGILDITL